MIWGAFLSVCAAAAVRVAAAGTEANKPAWGATKFLFTFGDSYTTDGFNISAGVNSPVPGFVRLLFLVPQANLTAPGLDVLQRSQLGAVPR